MKYFHDVSRNGQGVSASSEHTTIIDNERTFSKRSQTQPNHMLIIDRFFKRCQSQPKMGGWGEAGGREMGMGDEIEDGDGEKGMKRGDGGGAGGRGGGTHLGARERK